MTNVLEVILNLVDNMSGGLDAASSSVENLESSVNSAGDAIDTMSSASMEDIAAGADAAGLSMEQVGEAASSASAGIGGIDTSGVKEAGNSANAASTEMEGLAGSVGLVEGAMAALAAIGIVEYLGSAADAAGAFTDRWERIGIVMDEGGASVAELQSRYGDSIKSMQATTGRGLGQVQNSIINLGIAGVNSKDVLISSFNAISGQAFIKNGGKDVDAIAGSFTRMVQTGKVGARQLMALGVSTDGANRALEPLGMTLDDLTKKFPAMTAEERASMLSMILNANGAAEGNIKWKESWGYVTYQMGLAFDYINRIVGSLILPILIPVIETATKVLKGMGDTLSNLPGPVKSVMGFIITLAGGLATLLGGVVGANAILGLLGTSLGGVGSALVGLLGSLGPVGWAILAIIGIVIGAIAIWQTWSKEIIALKDAIMSGDWGNAAGMIANSFNYVGTGIMGALENAWNQIVNFFVNLPAMLGNAASAMYDIGVNVMHWIVTGLMSLSGKLQETLTKMLADSAKGGGAGGKGGAGAAVGENFIDGFFKWAKANAPKIASILGMVFMKAIPLLMQVIGQISLIIILWLGQAAFKGGMQFFNLLKWWFFQVPAMVAGALMNVVIVAAAYFTQLVLTAVHAASTMLNNFINYVGQMPGYAAQIIGSVVAWFMGLPARIGAALTGIKDAIVQQLWNAYNGAMSMLNAFIDIGRQIKDKVIQGIMNAFGISSPSKETYTLGEAISQGLLEGMKNWVLDNWEKFIDPVKKKLGNGLDILVKTFGNFKWIYYMNSMQSVATTLSTMTGNCWDAAVAFISLASNMGIAAELYRTFVGSVPHMVVNLPQFGAWIDPSGILGRGLQKGTAPGSAAGGSGAGMSPESTTTETIVSVNHTFDLENVPQGNDDKTIAKMVVDSLKNKKVVETINQKLGSLKNQKARSRGV